MLIGYARVSTLEQHLDLQIDSLNKCGCEKIFQDKVTGVKDNRPGLNRTLDFMREGDTLVVWKLDRLGRSLKHLVEIINDLQLKNKGFKSLQENIDTTSKTGKFIFHMFAALSEFERDIIKERTMAGLASARARGRLGGRPKTVDEKLEQLIITMSKDHSIPVIDICKTLGISRSTYYRYVKMNKKKLKSEPPDITRRSG